MEERIFSLLSNSIIGLGFGLGFAWLCKKANAKLFATMSVFARKHDELEEKLEDLKNHVTDCSNLLFDEFANIEEKIVMVHQDILYMDSDLGDVEERVIRLEYRPNVTKATADFRPQIEPIDIPERVEAPLRRMRELRRRRRG